MGAALLVTCRVCEAVPPVEGRENGLNAEVNKLGPTVMKTVIGRETRGKTYRPFGSGSI
jgi:hypothetical protein